MRFIVFIPILTATLPAFSQKVPPAYVRNSSFTGNTFVRTDSGFIINHYYRKCKDVIKVVEFVRVECRAAASISASVTHPAPNTKLLIIHGNLSYDFFYRSRLDTPIAQQNLYQHTEKVFLDVLLKEKYPLKVAFTLRQSNSPYFKDFADICFRFDRFGYYKKLKEDIIYKLSKSTGNNPGFDKLKALTEEKEKQVLQLKSWLESPATLQKIIEERERQYALQSQAVTVGGVSGFIGGSGFVRGALNNDAAIENSFIAKKENTDSLTSSFAGIYENKKRESDSVAKQIKLLHQKADSIGRDIQKRLISIEQKLNRAVSEKEIRAIAADYRIEAAPGKFERRLAAVKTFAIGRSMLNYTELTAQNITVTGLNVEYNPSYYAAFAAGKIDYRFRDFFNRNTTSSGQYVVLGRIGTGDSEKRALIFTVFQGRKNSSEFIPNDTAVNHLNIAGYSIESIFKKDENTSISFEVAKSTKPITGNLNKQINALWKFNDQSNLGVNIKGQTIVTATNTRLSGFYRKTGENFQSFSLFSYHTGQTAWFASADQSVFKQKVSVTGILRRNDFTNPFTDKTFKTSTVFKSLLLHIRIPRYPFINLGYYPGSQLYIVNKEKVKENVYYLLNGSLVHSYFYKGTGMNSSLMYNRYFNRATDSGFVLARGAAYYVTQTVFLKKSRLQVSYAYNDQPELKYFTMETSVDYALKQFFKITAAAKYNKIIRGNSYLGEAIRLDIDLKQPGRLQFQYEKGFLPAINQTLYPVEIGRISWSKYF